MTKQAKTALVRWLHKQPRKEQYKIRAAWLLSGDEGLADLARRVRSR